MVTQGCNADGVAYDVFVEHDSVETGFDFSEGGRTRQEFADECDINKLLDRYETTGVLTHYTRMEPVYMDLTEGSVSDLASALRRLEHAQAMFLELPAKVRREFDNDPVKFVEFAEKPDNLDRMREWGLAPPLPVDPQPVKVELVNPPASSEAK